MDLVAIYITNTPAHEVSAIQTLPPKMTVGQAFLISFSLTSRTLSFWISRSSTSRFLTFSSCTFSSWHQAPGPQAPRLPAPRPSAHRLLLDPQFVDFQLLNLQLQDLKFLSLKLLNLLPPGRSIPAGPAREWLGKGLRPLGGPQPGCCYSNQWFSFCRSLYCPRISHSCLLFKFSNSRIINIK